MAYLPNAVDATNPLDSTDASTAAAEFRALKAYVQTLVLTAGQFSPVRQTIQDGVINATGDAAFFTAPGGGGLALDLKAAGRPLVVNFAGGNTGTGVNDRLGSQTNDVANVVAALAANNTSFLLADYVSAGVFTWSTLLAPPQYGKVYNQAVQSLLKFSGANASTTILDDYGNSWTAAGNAQLSTGTLIDTLNTLALDGTGDWVDSTNITTLGSGSWTVEIKVRWPVLPPASTIQMIAEMSTSGFGMQLFLQADVTPTRTLRLNLSSNGTSNDIAVLVGASTTWAAATTYHFAVCYDGLTGKYFVYKDGVQDSTVTSSLKIAIGSKMRIGANVGAGTQGFNGNVAGFRFLPYCAYPNGATFAVPSLATFTAVGPTSSDFFDNQAMKMYTVSAASSVAGVNPTLTQKYRLYFGEVDTSGLAVTAVRNYAFGNLGKGQTWQSFNFGSYRVIGVTYTNNTGRPIMVSVGVNYGVGSSMNFSCGGIIIGFGSNANASGVASTNSWVVPSGVTYSVLIAGGAPTLNQWAELR